MWCGVRPCLFLLCVALALSQNSQSWMDQGLQHLRNARYEQAIEAFHRAVDLDPSLALAHFDLGVSYFASGHFGDARKAFQQAQHLKPVDPFTIYYLARVDLLEDHLDAAIQAFESLARKHPVADELYYLGSAYFRRGDLDSAEHSLLAATANNPNDHRIPFLLGRTLQRLGRESEARNQFARSAQLRDAQRESAEGILDCNSALNKLPQQAAIAKCRKALYGTDPIKLVSLGVAFGEHGLYTEAIDPLVKAAKLNPEDYEPAFNLGATYFRLKRYADARPLLEAAVSLRPEAFETVALLGSALFALGDDASALPYLRHAHTLRPADLKISALLFQELTITGRHLHAERDYPKAASLIDEALGLKPDAVDLHSEAAELALAMGDSSRAERERALVERYRNHP